MPNTICESSRRSRSALAIIIAIVVFSLVQKAACEIVSVHDLKCFKHSIRTTKRVLFLADSSGEVEAVAVVVTALRVIGLAEFRVTKHNSV
jgi:uncharacterized protein with ATP-grasp and redox domains